MPNAKRKPCSMVGCNTLTLDSRCPKHPYKGSRTRQGEKAQSLYDHKWQKASKAYLVDWPLCRHCHAENKARASTVVDHVIPHRGDPKLFWDKSNWQPLCKPHHDAKTGRGE